MDNRIMIFVKAAQKQLLENEDSVLHAFIGRRRSGKSTTALLFCCLIDNDFTADQIVFTIDEFRKATKRYKGKAILFDEAGVAAYSRDFMKEINKELNKLLQVFGFKQLYIALTFQHLSFLDKHTRTLCDVIFKCRKDRVNGNNSVIIEPYAVVTDWIQEPVVTPYKILKNGRSIAVGSIYIPSLEKLVEKGIIKKQLLKEYLQKKEEFFENLGENSEDEYLGYKYKVSKKEIAIELYKLGIDIKKIAKILRLDERDINNYLQSIKS